MIRNTAVHKAVPKDAPSAASNAMAARTTTGKSLINNPDISNVERLNRPANDNKQFSRGVKTPNFKKPRPRASNDNRLKSVNTSQVQDVAGKVVDAANAASAAWFIIGTTWIFYMVQFVFSVLSLVGLVTLVAVDETWLGYVDFMNLLSGTAETMTYIGMGITTVLGIFTLILAIIIFKFRGVDIGKEHSILVMAVCFALNAVPGFSFFPWIWVWCLYVVKSQVSK